MNRILILVGMVFLCSVHSCNSGSVEKKEQIVPETVTVFDLDNLSPTVDKLRLSDIAESIDYIPLETRDDCLLGSINGMKFTDEYVFLMGVGDIFQFDHQGKFIRRLFRVGKGPGECYARDFAIDALNSQIYVYDNFKPKYNIYNFDGEFINSLDDPNPDNNTGSHFMVQNNQLVFEVSDYAIPQNFIMSYDIGLRELVYKYENNYKEIDDSDVQKKKWSVWNSGLLRSFEDKILFKEKFCDTIYQTIDFTELTPRYVLMLDKNELTYKDYHTVFIKEILDKRFIVDYFETSRYVIVQTGPLRNIWIYDKTVNSIVVIEASTPEDWNLENDLDSGPEISIIPVFELALHRGDYIYSYIEPFTLFEAVDSEDFPIAKDSRMYELVDQLNENDNPILVKIKLKTSSEN